MTGGEESTALKNVGEAPRAGGRGANDIKRMGSGSPYRSESVAESGATAQCLVEARRWPPRHIQCPGEGLRLRRRATIEGGGSATSSRAPT